MAQFPGSGPLRAAYHAQPCGRLVLSGERNRTGWRLGRRPGRDRAVPGRRSTLGILHVAHSDHEGVRPGGDQPHWQSWSVSVEGLSTFGGFALSGRPVVVAEGQRTRSEGPSTCGDFDHLLSDLGHVAIR